MGNPQNNRIDTASKVIGASPQAIYRAFMDPQHLVHWLPPKGMSARIDRFEPYAGGIYRIVLTYDATPEGYGKTSENTDATEGTFLELVQDAKIVQAGRFDSDNPAFAGEMIQTWYLEAVSGGTKVTIICENVPQGIRKEDHDTGLHSTLDNLALFTERASSIEETDRITGLHHAQITIPTGTEAAGKAFYCGVLGLREIDKPEALQGRGGFWLSVGNQEVHVGTEDGFDRLATKAHLAYRVENITHWRERLEGQGVTILEAVAIPGFARFEFRDPFGNRVELIQVL